MKLVPKLLQIRESQGRGRPWVASKIGIGRSTLESWEKGESMVPYDKARALARLYGVTLEGLYEEVEE